MSQKKQKERIYSRVPSDVLALIREFATMSGLTLTDAIAVLIVMGLGNVFDIHLDVNLGDFGIMN